MNSLGEFLGGLFGHPDRAYQKAEDQYQKYYNEGQGYQQPFYDAGTGAIPQFQNWLSSMQDPSGFINNLMQNYKQSDYARAMQKNAMRSAINAGSASGMIGSTPLMNQIQQNSNEISQGDLNSWLSQVLGINTQYGNGLNNLMGFGQHASDMMSQAASQMGDRMGDAEYGKEAAKQNRWSQIIGGGLGLIGDGIGYYNNRRNHNDDYNNY